MGNKEGRVILMTVSGEQLANIFARIRAAEEEIYAAYDELRNVMGIEIKEPVSGN